MTDAHQERERESMEQTSFQSIGSIFPRTLLSPDLDPPDLSKSENVIGVTDRSRSGDAVEGEV